MGNRFQGGHADARDTGGQGHAAGRRQADAEPGKGAGTDRHRQPVEVFVSRPGLIHNRLHHRHQGFRLAALHHPELMGNDGTVVP